MPNTLELLAKALEIKTKSEWARHLNVMPSVFTRAAHEGRLSPALAGNLAIEIGEDAGEWMIAAMMESKQETALISRLRQRKPEWRKLLLPNNTPKARRCGFFQLAENKTPRSRNKNDSKTLDLLQRRMAGLFYAVDRPFRGGNVAIEDQRQIRQ